MLAALGGMHFLSYSWLHRTRLYIYLGTAISIGAFVLLILLRTGEFSVTMFYVGIIYWITAPLVYRHAARLVRESAG